MFTKHNQLKVMRCAGLFGAVAALILAPAALADDTDSAQLAPSAADAAAAVTQATGSTAASNAPASTNADPTQSQALATSDPAMTATSPGASVAVPTSSAGVISLDQTPAVQGIGSSTTSNGSSGDANAITVSVPHQSSTSDAQVAGSDVAVYSGTSTDASTAVQATSGGMNISTIIGGSDAPTDYRFPIGVPDDASIVSDGGGGYQILDATGAVISDIASPWAQDANGNPVPTSYSLDGTTLIQHVDLINVTAYPVVADPSFHVGWTRMAVVFSRDDTHWLQHNIALGGGAVAVTSYVCKRLPEFAAECTLMVGVAAGYTWNVINNASRQNKCFGVAHDYFAALWSPGFIYPYVENGGWCSNR